MEWNENEIIDINGTRYLNKEASERFFEKYKEIFIKYGKTSVDCLLESFCINLLERLNVQTKQDEVKEEDKKKQDEADMPKKEEDKQDDIDDPRVFMFIGDFTMKNGNNPTSIDIAKYVVELNDDIKRYGGPYDIKTLEVFAMSMCKHFEVEYKKSDINDAIGLKIEENKKKLAKEKEEAEKERKLREDIKNNILPLLIDNATDLSKLAYLCNIAVDEKLHSSEETAKCLYIALSSVYDLNNIEVLEELITDIKQYDLKCIDDFSNVIGANRLPAEVAIIEPIELGIVEEPPKQEERLKLNSRRKPESKKDKKKIIYALISGAGIISAGFLTFCAKVNPINVVTECATTFANLFKNNATLLELASKLGNLTLYFGSVIAGWKGACGLANQMRKEDQERKEEEDEGVIIINDGSMEEITSEDKDKDEEFVLDASALDFGVIEEDGEPIIDLTGMDADELDNILKR